MSESGIPEALRSNWESYLSDDVLAFYADLHGGELPHIYDGEGHFDIEFRKFKGQVIADRLTSPTCVDDLDYFALRGLMANYSSIVKRPGAELEGEIPSVEAYHVGIYRSPEGINMIQELLGRHPGVDAFKIVRSYGERNELDTYTAGSVLEHLTRLEIPVNGPGMAQFDHDLNPSIHEHVWWATPTSISLPVQKRAIGLMHKHGEYIHLPRSDRPREVGEFVDVLDTNYRLQLQEYFFRVVGQIEDEYAYLGNASHSSAPNKALDFIDEGQFWVVNFELLGAIDAELDDEEKARRAQGLVADIFINLGHIHINLDALVPREDPKEVFRETWQKVVDVATAKKEELLGEAERTVVQYS